MRFLLLLTVAAAAAFADEDPPGTVPLEITAGKSVPIQTVAGSHVLCDDLKVVTPEFSEDGSGFVLLGVGPGTTLCGVWFGEQKPGGLYRVTVVAQGPPAEPPPAVKTPQAAKPAVTAQKKDAGL